jgi:hypothetical protein
MVGKQFSLSVINLTTSNGSNGPNHSRHHANSICHDSTNINLLEQRKHALSEEHLSATVGGDIKVLLLL